ncbi:DUF1232 domain-containing protein [bacterium]|nr:DUF1232 domain-containing protein [bacterium]
MIAQLVRQQTAAVRAQPGSAYYLRQRLNAFLHEQGQESLPDTEVDQLIQILEEYIDYTPTLLEQCTTIAQLSGVGSTAAPFLQQAAHYFLEPNDLIPDHYGLYGLLDDAYLANSYLMDLSLRYKRLIGISLLPVDLCNTNQIVRAVIGEQVAAQLDQIWQETARIATAHSMQQTVENWFRGLASGRQQSSIGWNSSGSWGGMFEDRVAAFGARNGVSLNVSYDMGDWS